MFQNIIDYCKNPQYNIEKRSISFKGFAKLYIICQLCIMGIVVPVGILASLTGITNILHDESIKLLILGILIAPFIEETMFRLLLRPTKQSLVVFMVIVLLWVIGLILRQKFFMIYIPLSILLLVTLAIFIVKRNPNFMQKHFRWIFYLSICAFALIHISNFEGLRLSVIIITPLLVLPQLLMGFAFSYTRMLHGFRYAVLMHMCINAFAFMPTIFKVMLSYL